VKRREFIAGLGSAAAWPLAARAQQQAIPVIGYLGEQSADDSEIATVPFLESLKQTGYIVGQNVAIEYRWAENQVDRLPALAADLVPRHRGFDWLISSHLRMGISSGGTRSWMLRATPGWRRIKPFRSRVTTIW